MSTANARHLRRLQAMAVDLVIVIGWAALVALGAALLGTTEYELGPAAWDLVAFLTLVGPVILACATWEASAANATPGKRWSRLRVVTSSGLPPSLPRTLLRSTITFLPWQLAHTAVIHLSAGSEDVVLLVVAIMAQLAVLASTVLMMLDPRRRAMHDIAAGTLVVPTRQEARRSSPR